MHNIRKEGEPNEAKKMFESCDDGVGGAAALGYGADGRPCIPSGGPL